MDVVTEAVSAQLTPIKHTLQLIASLLSKTNALRAIDWVAKKITIQS